MRPESYYSIQEQRAHNERQIEIANYWEDMAVRDFDKVQWSLVCIGVAIFISKFF